MMFRFIVTISQPVGTKTLNGSKAKANQSLPDFGVIFMV